MVSPPDRSPFPLPNLGLTRSDGQGRRGCVRRGCSVAGCAEAAGAGVQPAGVAEASGRPTGIGLEPKASAPPTGAT